VPVQAARAGTIWVSVNVWAPVTLRVTGTLLRALVPRLPTRACTIWGPARLRGNTPYEMTSLTLASLAMTAVDPRRVSGRKLLAAVVAGLAALLWAPRSPLVRAVLHKTTVAADKVPAGYCASKAT
jgi:hypothetical protein